MISSPLISVNKIGGVNMSQLNQVKRMINVLRDNKENIILVVSAFKGATNALIAAMDELSGTDYGEKDIKNAFGPVKELHEEIIMKFLEGESASKAKTDYQIEYEKLEESLIIHKKTSSILAPTEKSFAIRDRVIGFGEKMAGAFLEIFLEKEGYSAYFISDVECGPDTFNGQPVAYPRLHAAMREAIRAGLEKSEKKQEEEKMAAETRAKTIRIFGGHVGNTPRGIVIDVGRSYSDTTAVNVALLIREKYGSVLPRFWKDVDGVLSANPKDLGPENRPLRHDRVDMWEGLEAAAAGSQLMQVDALALAEAHKLDLRLQNIAVPEKDQGTNFSNCRIIDARYPFKMIISNANIDTLTITLPQMANKKGFGAAITAILDQNDLSFDSCYTEGTSLTFSIPLPPDKKDQAACRRRIEKTVKELEQITVDGEKYTTRNRSWKINSLACLSIIGNELSEKPGMPAKIMAVLNEQHIDIKSVVHGEAQRRLTIMINCNQRAKAVQALHSAFFDHP